MRSVIALVLLVVLCRNAVADGFALTLDYGYAEPGESSFDGAYTGAIAGGYRFSRYAVMLGYLQFNEFEYKGSSATFVDVEGGTLSFSAEFPVSSVALSIGAGLYYWDADARFQDVKIGNQTDTSAFLDARVLFPLASWFDLYLGLQHFNDVTGSDINRLMFGARFSAGAS